MNPKSKEQIEIDEIDEKIIVIMKEMETENVRHNNIINKLHSVEQGLWDTRSGLSRRKWRQKMSGITIS